MNADTLEKLLLILIPSLIASVPAVISAVASRKNTAKQLDIEREKNSSERKKIEVEVAEKVATTYKDLINSLKEEMERRHLDYEERLKEQEVKIEELSRDNELLKSQLIQMATRAENFSKKIGRLQNGIQRLTDQIKSAGLKPVYTVSKEDMETDNGH